MNHALSYETALRLKAAGFPTTGDAHLSATDILNELRDANITYVHLTPAEALTTEEPHAPRRMFRAEAQIVNTTGLGFNPNLTKVMLFEHENAAEAVAAVWLAIHENAAS